MTELGLRLKKARDKARLSQEEVERRTGVSRSTIGGLEKGQRGGAKGAPPANPPLQTLALLAWAYGVDLHDLIPRT